MGGSFRENILDDALRKLAEVSVLPYHDFKLFPCAGSSAQAGFRLVIPYFFGYMSLVQPWN
jgi:hypothetical protein